MSQRQVYFRRVMYVLSLLLVVVHRLLCDSEAWQSPKVLEGGTLSVTVLYCTTPTIPTLGRVQKSVRRKKSLLMREYYNRMVNLSVQYCTVLVHQVVGR